jgi:hypothetical protein
MQRATDEKGESDVTSRTSLAAALAAAATTMLVACGQASPATATTTPGTAEVPTAAPNTPAAASAPAPPPPTKLAPPVNAVVTEASSSSTAEMHRYKTQIAPLLFRNSVGIDAGFQQLLSSNSASATGPSLAADIKKFALDPSVQLLGDARGYAPGTEPLTSIHAIFLEAADQKIRRYTAFVDGATSGDKNDLAVAQAAAQQEDADLKNWAKQVTALP